MLSIICLCWWLNERPKRKRVAKALLLDNDPVISFSYDHTLIMVEDRKNSKFGLKLSN